MPGLPKSYIKKYGITKKAWSMYRASKGKKKASGNPGKGKKTKSKAGRKMAKNKSRGRSLGPEINHLLGSLGAYFGEEIELTQVRPRIWKADEGPEKNKEKALMAGVVDLALGYGVGKVGRKARLPRSLVNGFQYAVGGKGIGLIKYNLTGWGGLFKPKEE